MTSFQKDLLGLYNNYKSFFTDSKFVTEENKDVFLQADSIFKAIATEFEKISVLNTTVLNKSGELNNLYKTLLDKKEALKEEFAKIKREIDIPNVNPDDFLKLNKTIETDKSK